MAKIEVNTEINAKVEKVYSVVDDVPNFPNWNVVIREMNETEPGVWFVKTNVGDITSKRIEDVPNERVTDEQTGPMSKMGYIFNPKGDITEVTLWAEFDDEAMSFVLEKAGEIFLKCLKHYVEYLESEGDPDSYDKNSAL